MTAFLTLLLLSAPHGVQAQSCGPPEPGDRIRYTLAPAPPPEAEFPLPEARVDVGSPREARVLAVTPDHLSVTEDGREITLRLEELETLEVLCPPEGRGRHVAQSVLLGGLGGALLGGALICATRDRYDRDYDGNCSFGDDEAEVLRAAAIGGVVGAALGAVVGMGTGPDGAWEDVPLSLRTGPTPDGGWTVGLRIPVGG